jgi:quinol monooxygenase YgiN
MDGARFLRIGGRFMPRRRGGQVMLIVTGAVIAAPDTVDTIVAEAARHVAQSRTQRGCIAHAWHRDPDDPLRIVFLERWTDMAALRTHFAHPGSARFMTTMRGHAQAIEPIEIFEAMPVAP